MEFALYQQPKCPFCKHFKRLFFKYIPEGKEVLIPDHNSELWIEHKIDFVPTVILYNKDREIERLGAEKLVGIRKNNWVEWLRMVKEKYGLEDLQIN